MNDAEVGGKVVRKRGGKASGQASREPDFEESLRRLEAIVGRLEAGELPLEETLRLFEEGQVLVRGCGGLLERAEQRVKELVEGTGETRDVAISGVGGAGASGGAEDREGTNA
jgi:exodeoxyribonuclease VII small subunit